MRHYVIISLGLVAVSFTDISMSAMAETSVREQLIQENIKPVGDVYLTGQAPQMASAGGAKTAESIYNGHCVVCHAAGVAGAPKFGNKADWAPRVAKGMETLLDHALHGYNAMPPKGTCMDCSDDEIKASIQYMLDHSK